MNKNEILRSLPAVDDILEREKVEKLIDQYNRRWVREAVRSCINDMRKELIEAFENEGPESAAGLAEDIIAQRKIIKSIKESLQRRDRPQLAPAVNATGVIVHTNLGRSLLSSKAREMLDIAAENYCTLEIDRTSGERGSRYDNISGMLCDLTGAEAAFVVNNNAAAVLLALSTFASDKEVIISRGELVEIGGSFRIPDVMEQSGARLVEVGTTNRVYPEDYERAVNEDTALLLKVHTSNYRIKGFSEEVEVEELKKIADKYDLPLLDDLGSGVMFDMRQFGLDYEPTLQERVAAGGDIITCSGDKILGGPQAGIVLGEENLIERMKKNPLTRAVRVDKLTLAALEGTLKSYYEPEQAVKEIPTLQMLNRTEEDLHLQAENLKKKIEKNTEKEGVSAFIKKDFSRVGGGAYPLTKLPTWTVVVKTTLAVEKAAKNLRKGYPPIFCRIADEQLIFDVRTLLKGDIEKILRAFEELEV